MIYPEGQKPSERVLASARIRAEAASDPNAARDIVYAERYEARARTKNLPSTRTEIGAGGELIDRSQRWPASPGAVDTIASPDYVTAEASRERAELANTAGALGLALDASDTIRAADSLEKMLMHQMSVLYRGAMKMAVRMNEEIDRERLAAAVNEATRESTCVRACRYAGSMSRMMATYMQGMEALARKRAGGVQKVQVSYTDQRVNVAEGGQAVIAGNNVQPRRGARRSAA